MTFVTFDVKSTKALKYFDTEGSAKRSSTVANKKNPGSVNYATYEYYAESVVTKKTVINLMSGKEVEIDSNTPRCCDVSSELYWSC